jgi:hypothetical protein
VSGWGSRAVLAASVVAAASLFGAPPPARAQAVALAGTDMVRLELPASGLVESYTNAGYRLRVEGGVATVEVSLAPLRSLQGFELPPPTEGLDPVAALARAVAGGATTRYQAVTQVLEWIARNLAYDLDRAAPQDAATVLARRTGYCTGVARLSVAMLQSLGIEARDVPGFLVAPAGATLPAGFHRWVEVHYADVGWVFSDPLLALHYVPATYVRLASEALLPGPEIIPGRLLERRDRRLAVDLFTEVPSRLTLRRNGVVRRAAALQVTVGGAGGGYAVLEGAGIRRVRALAGGESTFVGLEPGSYLLRVEVTGTSPRYKRIILRDRVWGSVHLPRPAPGGDPEPTLPDPRAISKEEST